MNDTQKVTHPQWWTSTHDTAWERGKAAFRRDWEQTRRDFGGAATDLNQDASDTLRQASGRAPVPPATIPNVPDAADVTRHANDARKAEKTAGNLATRAAAAPTGTPKAAKLEDKAIDAREVARTEAKALDRNVNLRWENVQAAMEYGFGAGMYHVPEWGDKTHTELRRDWQTLHPDRPWAEVEDFVHQGWNRARAASTASA